MRRRLHVALLLGLALFYANVNCYDLDDDEGYGGGGDEDGYGGNSGGYGGGDEGYGGGGEDEQPAPAGDARELTSVEEFDAFLDDNDASVVGAFLTKEMPDPSAVKPEGWDDEEDGEWSPETIPNPSLTTFNSITAETSGYRWAFTTTPEVLAKLKAKSESLFLYRSPRFVSTDHGDRPRERFPSSKLSQTSVSSWLDTKAQPLVGVFSSETKDRYVGRYGSTSAAKPAVLVIFMNLDFSKNAKSVKYVLKRARKVAQANKGKLSFAIASLSDMSYELEDYGLESKRPASDLLMGILHRTGTKDNFYGASAESFSEKSLSAFANAFLAGELTPHVKPEPPDEPADNDEGEGFGGDDEDSEADSEKDEM